MWPQVVALVPLLLRYLRVVFVPQMPENIISSFAKATKTSYWLLVLHKILVMVRPHPHLDINRPYPYPVQGLYDLFLPTGALRIQKHGSEVTVSLEGPDLSFVLPAEPDPTVS
jgi:hypothetical protein